MKKWLSNFEYQSNTITKLLNDKLYSIINKYFSVDDLIKKFHTCVKFYSTIVNKKHEALLTLIVNHSDFDSSFTICYDLFPNGEYHEYLREKKNEFISIVTKILKDSKIKIDYDSFVDLLEIIDDKELSYFNDEYLIIIVNDNNIVCNEKIFHLAIEKKCINFIDAIILNKVCEFNDKLFSLYISNIDSEKINLSIFKNFNFTSNHLNATINSNANVLVKHIIEKHNILPDDNTFNFYCKKYYYKEYPIQTLNDQKYLCKFLSENIIFSQNNLNDAFCNLDIDMIKEIYMSKRLHSLNIALCINFGLIYFNKLNLQKI